MGFQLTTLTTLIGVLAMVTAWTTVGRRIRNSATPALPSVKHLNRTFLMMGIFFTIMFLPSLWLTFDPSQFPLYMAWGYVVGHVFLYLAFIQVALMVISMVPALAGKRRLVVLAGSAVLVAVTVFNAVTMIWGTQPSFNYEQHVTQFNASPLVGAAIGLLALLTFLPAAVLFFRNAVKTGGARRTRSVLLGVGFAMMILGGPPHDVAGNWQTYLLGDLLTIASVIILTSGVLYRFEEEQLTLEQRSAA